MDQADKLRAMLAGEADLALRYVAEFECIGSDCEDNCCHSWRIMISKKNYEKLLLRAGGEAEERKRLHDAIKIEKGKKGRKTHFIRLRKDGLCPMLEGDGLCHIHGRYGSEYLPDVCASYPRMLQKIGDHLQQTATVSCPEVARKLLLHENATEVVDLDRDSLVRLLVSGGFDTRDARSYWKMQAEVRGFMLELLGRDEPLERRLFYMTYFAHRTEAVFVRDAGSEAEEAVRAEMRRLSDERVLGELGRRLDAIETPSHLVLTMARELAMRGKPQWARRDTFGSFLNRVIGTYRRLIEPPPEEADAGPKSAPMSTLEGWQDYSWRKRTVLERDGERVEQYFTNFAFNFWVQRTYFKAPDLMVFMQRLLTLMAVQKFLLFSHPSLLRWLSDKLHDEGTFREALDAAAVEVFFRVARDIEHGPLLDQLEKFLETARMKSFGGTVYLIRF